VYGKAYGNVLEHLHATPLRTIEIVCARFEKKIESWKEFKAKKRRS
jgi:histone deacetylase complex regulatory component SIN3